MADNFGSRIYPGGNADLADPGIDRGRRGRQLFSRAMSATWLVSQRAELQQNARASSNILNKDISLAGAGLPTGGVALASGPASKPRYGCDYTGKCYLGPTNTASITYPNQRPVSGNTINYIYGVIPGWKRGVTVNAAAGAERRDHGGLCGHDFSAQRLHGEVQRS